MCDTVATRPNCFAGRRAPVRRAVVMCVRRRARMAGLRLMQFPDRFWARRGRALTVTLAPGYAIVLAPDAPGASVFQAGHREPCHGSSANNERDRDDRTIDCNDRLCPACACPTCLGPNAGAIRRRGVGQRSSETVRTRAARCRPVDTPAAPDCTAGARR